MFTSCATWYKMMCQKNYYILDGGFGTELMEQGYESSVHNDPLWGTQFLHTNPDAVINVHKLWLEAGADIIETNTYQASTDLFSKHLNISTTDALILIGKAVHLAKEAIRSVNVERCVLVAGSVGPYGACQCDLSEYTGHYVDSKTEEELSSWHKPRIQTLIEAGVDLLAFDTIPALKEAEVLIDILQDYPNTKAWLSFSCKDGNSTCHGESFAEAVEAVVECDQIIAVGVNCTSPVYIEPLLKTVQHLRHKKPFIVYPNSGEEWSMEKDDKCWIQGGTQVSPLSTYIDQWLDLGARYIGGCCRTRPKDIADIKAVVERHFKDGPK